MKNKIHERNFEGIWIPKELWFFCGLSWAEKFLLLEIESLCGEKGCFVTNKSLGECIQIGKQQTSNIISKLNQLGLVEASFNGKSRTLKTSLPHIIKTIKQKLNVLK